MKIPLEYLISVLPGNIYWKDTNGNYLGCNKEFAKIARLNDPKEIVGKKNTDLFLKYLGNERIRALEAIDSEVITTGNEIVAEEIGINTRGEIAVYITKKIPFKNQHGKVVGVIGTSVDITKERKLEKELADQIRKNEIVTQSKIDFISIATHEIRNPVSNIRSSLDCLKENFMALEKLAADGFKVDEVVPLLQKTINENKDTLLSIDEQVDKTLKAVTDLGELARLQVYGTEVSYSKVNLDHLVEQVLETFNFQEKNITIKLDINSSFPELIKIDYQNILKVLEIVIGNALRFSPPNEIIQITVTEDIQKRTPSHIFIAIQDKGPGISQNQLNYIFATATGDNNPESRYRKPSLQLPQAKMLIEASGGHIAIQSILQQGTTVLLNFPYYPILQKDNHTESTTLSEQHEEENYIVNNLESNFNDVLPILKSWRLLLVEDNYETQQHMRRLFKTLNLALDIASTGQAAIEMINQYCYDLVFLDISLDDMTGIDVYRHLQSVQRQTLAVAVTSYHSDKDISFFLEQGIMTVLPKPVTYEELQECLITAYQVKNDD